MQETHPSALKEDEAIAIISEHGGGIGFHRYYGELQTFALPANGDPRQPAGVLITNDEKEADCIFLFHRRHIGEGKSPGLQIHYLSPEDPTLVWPKIVPVPGTGEIVSE